MMMRMLALAGFLALITLAAWGAETQPATQPATQAATEPGMLPIRYERSGGFAGTHDVVEIGIHGEVVVDGKLMGKGKGQLTPEQMTKLATLFADWKAAKYPAPPGSADGFEFKIRYGKAEVTASDMNEKLPEAFTAVQRAIEKIARDVTGK